MACLLGWVSHIYVHIIFLRVYKFPLLYGFVLITVDRERGIEFWAHMGVVRVPQSPIKWQTLHQASDAQLYSHICFG